MAAMLPSIASSPFSVGSPGCVGRGSLDMAEWAQEKLRAGLPARIFY